MKKVACTVLVFIMAIFLINPLSSEARGGHRGSHGGWWVPWAILGGAAVLAPYYAPPPMIIREQPPEYFQPAPSVAPAAAERLFVYPRQGQSEELRAKDRYECHCWAVNQTGFDPTQPTAAGMPETLRADYLRAQGACLDGRGYTVK